MKTQRKGQGLGFTAKAKSNGINKDTTHDFAEESFEVGAVDLEPVLKLNRHIKAKAGSLSRQEARYLVDLYYTIQDQRKRLASQTREASKSGEPNEIFTHFLENFMTLERQMKGALDAFSDCHEVGRWARSICGIGPVISAGLIAHIDIARAPTVGHVWSFGGYSPSVKWEKGQKRPYNADLKTLFWKIGESFVKVKANDSDIYGKLYDQRKELETARNEAGELADQAAAKLEQFNIGKTTEAYKWYSEGKLPPAHIHMRAKRWAVKMFLSHWHSVAYFAVHGEKPPAPYAITHCGHAHLIEVPNWPF